MLKLLIAAVVGGVVTAMVERARWRRQEAATTRGEARAAALAFSVAAERCYQQAGRADRDGEQLAALMTAAEQAFLEVVAVAPPHLAWKATRHQTALMQILIKTTLGHPVSEEDHDLYSETKAEMVIEAR